ncbi:MAG: nitrogenase molybdenum-iron protein subunit beta [Endomicrobiales bacterium]|jgi:nitrogenase molybdenum-iron protein beta chain
MLLRHTTKEIKERSALTVNPAKTCQPIGAMYAALGIHRCLPHSHGSQGCCSYHRSALTRHYKDPVMASTSSFTEGSSVFGGQSNLLESITNIFSLYNPDIIAVHTTCLSETIGDDIGQIIGKAIEEKKIPTGKYVIHANTPSYIGSHVTGFSSMVKGMVKYLAEKKGETADTLNIVPGWVEPSDMREIKRITDTMDINTILFPDTSDVLDTPLTGKFTMYPKGGVSIDRLKRSGDSYATLALGSYGSLAAAEELDAKHKVHFEALDIPYGITATDRFMSALRKTSGRPVPVSIADERGRLVDMISDMEQYLYGKRVALFGDPDQLIPVTEFLVDLGMKPVYIVTGTSGKNFDERLTEILKNIPEAKFRSGAGADMFLLHQWIKNENVDLLMGNTYGKYISRDDDIPFVRFGFPILDRSGHSYFTSVGYQGAMRLLERILSVLMDRQDRDAPEEKFELVM